MNLDIHPPLPKRKDFRIGILGSGFIVDQCHLVAYRKAGFNPVAIASRNRGHAAEVAARHGIAKVHDTYSDLLADPSIEVLDIAVPPNALLPLVREACERRTVKGILAQKPLGVNYAEALEIVNYCQRAGITLAVNQNMRFDQSVRAAKTLLTNGTIGEPVLATIEMRGIPHWQPWQAGLGWATLRIMSIHHLDTFRYWFGSPARIFCSTRPDPRTKFPHADGICTYILEYANGLRCVAIDDPWTGPAKEGCPSDIYIKWRIEGLNGLAIGDIGWCKEPYTTPSTIRYAAKGQEHFESPVWAESWFPDAFIGTMADLLIALENKTEPTLSGRDNLRTMDLVEAAYESAKQHQALDVRGDAFVSEEIPDQPKPKWWNIPAQIKYAKENPPPANANNFTPRAIQVLSLARKEAARLNHNFVGAEHLLLGLIALGQGVASTVLNKLGLNLDNTRAELEKLMGRGPATNNVGNMPYTPRVKKVLAFAARQAKSLNHTFVGTEHLLLGLLEQREGMHARILKNLNVDADLVRQEILRELSPYYRQEPSVTIQPAAAESSSLSTAEENPFVNFSPRSQQILALSRREAQRFDHNFVGTEHLLLALTTLGYGTAVNVLIKLGVKLDDIRAEVEKQLGRGPGKVLGHIPYTPRVKKVLAFAARQAKSLNHTYIGTEHILLGMIEEGGGVAARILEQFNVNLEKAREEIIKKLDPSSPHKTPANLHSTTETRSRIISNEFTPRASQAMELAHQEAVRFKHNHVGSEHLLLGLIALGTGVAVNVLAKVGMSLQDSRNELEKISGRGPDDATENPPCAPSVGNILALASEYAKKLNHTYIGTEHILLGLLEERDGIHALIFKRFEVNTDEARQEILRELQGLS